MQARQQYYTPYYNIVGKHGGYPEIAPTREFIKQFWRRGETSDYESTRRINPHSTFLRSPAMARIEAVLLVSGGPISLKKLVQVAMIADQKEALEIIDQLNFVYQSQQSPFVIELLASGYQLLTKPAYAYWLNRLHNRKATLNLSTIAMETLTIIAYRQPVTRAEVEKIRGVHCSEVIKQLMERGLVRIAGQDDSLGRPFVYETTPLFLESFGFTQITDLPGYVQKAA